VLDELDELLLDELAALLLDACTDEATDDPPGPLAPIPLVPPAPPTSEENVELTAAPPPHAAIAHPEMTRR
jgi:hypothetical protein